MELEGGVCPGFLRVFDDDFLMFGEEMERMLSQIVKKDMRSMTKYAVLDFDSRQALAGNCQELAKDFIEKRPVMMICPELEREDLGEGEMNDLMNLQAWAGKGASLREMVMMDTFEYKMNEVDFVKEVGVIYRARKQGVLLRDLAETVDAAKVRNLELYGQASLEVLKRVVVEIFRMAWSNLELGARATWVLKELEEKIAGFFGEDWREKIFYEGISGNFLKQDLQDEKILQLLDEQEIGLPKLNKDCVEWLDEWFYGVNYEVTKAVRELWEDRQLERGSLEITLNGREVTEFFVKVVKMFGWNRAVQIVVEPEGDEMRWDPSRMAVVIGEMMRPVESAREIFGRMIGILVRVRRELEAMNRGMVPLFTGGSHWGFGEEFARLAEELMLREDLDWNMGNMGAYMAVALTQLFEVSTWEIYEILWRCFLLVNLEDGMPSEGEFLQAKRNAFGVLAEVFCGMMDDTKRDLAVIGALHFGREGMQLHGRLRVIKYLNMAWKHLDVEMLKFCFAGNFDPTIQEHVEIVREYGVEVPRGVEEMFD